MAGVGSLPFNKSYERRGDSPLRGQSRANLKGETVASARL
jgi:hypothetical protein